MSADPSLVSHQQTSQVSEPRASLDAWAEEVFAGCVARGYTPPPLSVEDPMRLEPYSPLFFHSVTSAPGADGSVATEIYTTAEASTGSDSRSGTPVHERRAVPFTSESFGYMESLPAHVLRGAYRVRTPCIGSHNAGSGPQQNCLVSPTCLAGLQTLSTEPQVLKDCVEQVMGTGPALLPVPSADAAATHPDAPSTSAGKNSPAAEPSVALSDCAITAGYPCLWNGIRNLGNTCYFNAALQLLFHLKPVRQALLAECGAVISGTAEAGATPALADGAAATTAVDVDAADAVSRSDEVQVCQSGVCELFAQMAFGRDGCGADPTSFFSFLSLDRSVQQDAQEFLTLLVDWLRCHCGPRVKQAIDRSMKGTLLYDRRCSACGRSTKRAEPFLYLSLPVRPTLLESLSEFAKPEEVEGFACEGCGQQVVASSRQYLRSLPEVLVVHLNRFEFDVRSLQRQKLLASVQFPLALDMRPYERQWAELRAQTPSPSHATAGPPGTTEPTPAGAPAESDDLLYELRGVLNHHGDSALSGHYTYDGRTTSGAGTADGTTGWLNFNDSEVTPLQRFRGACGSSKDAYLLVYSRVRRSPSSTPEETVTAAEAGAAPGAAPSATGAASPPAPPHAHRGALAETPSPAEFPDYLLQYVAHLNFDAVQRRQRWLSSRKVFEVLLHRWAAAARVVFAPPPAPVDMPELHYISTGWLMQFGRFFLPASLPEQLINGAARTERRPKADAAALSSAERDALPSEELVCSPSMTSEGIATGVPLTSQTSHGHDSARSAGAVFFDGILHNPLGQAAANLRCEHNRLAPWSVYKAISTTAFEAIVSFMSFCASFMQREQLQTFADATVWRPAEIHSYSSQPPLRLCEANLCGVCVAALASTVVHASRIATDDAKTLATLAIQHDPQEQLEQHLTGSEELVYVAEDAVRVWCMCLQQLQRWRPVEAAAGFTGSCVMRQNLLDPPLPPLQSTAESEVADEFVAARVGALSSGGALRPSAAAVPGQILCPHQQLRPTAEVRVVPEALRRYWLSRLPTVVQLAQHNARFAAAVASCGAEDGELEEHLLPRLPVQSVGRCPACAQASERVDLNRHRQRLHRFEEARRFPTLLQAGKFTSASGRAALMADAACETEEQLLQTQHPNRDFFRRYGERAYREHAKRWRASQAAVIAAQEEQVAQRRAELAEQQAKDAQWRAIKVTSRRGQAGRGRRPPGPAEQTEEVAASADPSSPAGRLAHAEQVLAELQAATPPPLCEAAGCVPTWWVARWYRRICEDYVLSEGWADAGGGGLPPLPPLHYRTFLCPHQGSLLHLPWLNPGDGFWQGSRVKRAERLWLHTARTEAAPLLSSSSSSSELDGEVQPPVPNAADQRVCAWLPPLVVLPIAELEELLRSYGSADVLTAPLKTTEEQGDTPAECTPAAEMISSPNLSCIVQLREHGGVQSLHPPTCASCCRELVERFEESCEKFSRGSLKLLLHVRKSKKQFLDASGTLRGAEEDHGGSSGEGELSYRTTLAQLRLMVAHYIQHAHGYITPPEKLEFLKGRKPLRRGPAAEHRAAACADVDAEEVGNGAPPPSLESATLFELGIKDGDTLLVNFTEDIATACDAASDRRRGPQQSEAEEELWQEVPPELLQAGYDGGVEHTAAFSDTRLLGKKQSSSVTATAPVEPEEQQGIACSVCTFLNAPGMVVCEMCETPLTSQ